MRKILALLFLAVLSAVGTSLFAWNPLLTSGGELVKWDAQSQVVWNPDGGGLGKLTNAQATVMVGDEFAKWQAVATATIAFGQGGQIVDPATGQPTDVTAANYSDVINSTNEQNPIIFDNDREIFDMLGTPSGVVGFAGVLRISGTTITKGYAVLQGDWYDDEPGGTAPSDPGELSETSFRGMLVHEFGHFIGLGHSSVNHELVNLPGCPAPTAFQLETMGPYLGSDALTLEHDEAMGVSALYPTQAFQNDYSTIRGQLIDRDGVSYFEGANIVMRPDGADCDQRYEQAQAMQSGVAPTSHGGPGSYSFSGLSPGGGCTLLATTINDGGSYRIPPPPTLGGPDDYYNGVDEDWFGDVDDPLVSSAVIAPAGGTTLSGIDIKINNAGGPGRIPGDPVDGLLLERFDGSTPLPPEDHLLDDGAVNSASSYGGTTQAAWVNRFTPGPTELPFRLERIDLMFWHGSVDVGRSLRLLVYTDPTASGDPANATLIHTEDVTVQLLSTTQFNEYTLSSPVMIGSGEYYIGAYDLVADAPTTFIMSSDTDTASGRSYRQPNDTDPAGYSVISDRTWMVRAHGSTVPPAGSVHLSWGEPCNADTVELQDFAVYEGELSSLSAAPDHQPLACGTARERSFTVADPGIDRYWLVGPLLATREGSLGAGSAGSDRSPATSCLTTRPDPCP